MKKSKKKKMQPHLSSNRQVQKGKDRAQNRKENPLTVIGEAVYKITKPLLKTERTCSKLRKLQVASKQEVEKLCEQYYISIFTNIVKVTVGFLLLIILVWIKSLSKEDKIMLERDTYGGVSGNLELEAEINQTTERFSVEVLPVTYDEAELEEIFQTGFAYIDSVYLGENESAEEIRTDLNLIDSIDDLGLQVFWSSDQSQLIHASGKVAAEVPEDPVIIELTARLKYGEYEADKQYPVRLVGREVTGVEAAISKIQSYIYDLQVEAYNTRNLELPEEIYGYQIKKPQKTNPVLILVFLGIFAAVMIPLKKQSDLKSDTVLRNQVLLMAYPGFIDQLTLYMGAGLTIKGALKKIAFSGNRQQTEGHKFDNLLHEEINYTLNEIQAGMPESEAYYKLGHRLNLLVYLKITSLLSQNIKKGTRDILELLAEEETAVLQLRKELAKKKGEEAGTRLLFPMLLLLGTVIVIVVLPALMSF